MKKEGSVIPNLRQLIERPYTCVGVVTLGGGGVWGGFFFFRGTEGPRLLRYGDRDQTPYFLFTNSLPVRVTTDLYSCTGRASAQKSSSGLVLTSNSLLPLPSFGARERREGERKRDEDLRLVHRSSREDGEMSSEIAG